VGTYAFGGEALNNQKLENNSYEATLDLARSKDGRDYVMVLVKYTYLIRNNRCILHKPEPLLYDYRDEDLEPRLQPGTDFWPCKMLTDFVVQGSAFAPNKRPIDRIEVSVQVAKTIKRIAVFGKRLIQWTEDRINISMPEPFEEIPLTYQNAYGGIDWRVQISEKDQENPELILSFVNDQDHPGLYPRNPFGKGYLVEQGEVPDMVMPNLEDPSDLITPERLVIKDPKLWYRQPLPWCFDWVHPITFPRYVFMLPEMDAWYPGPEDEQMPEVKRIFIPSGYHSQMRDRNLLSCPHPNFFQEASHGLVFSDLKGNEPVKIVGMHPEKPVIEFYLPGHTPVIEIQIEEEKKRVMPRLHSVVCRPAENILTMLFGATMDTPKRFVPGIHKNIPISAYIDGGEPLRFEAPPTIRELLKEAEKKGGFPL